MPSTDLLEQFHQHHALGSRQRPQGLLRNLQRNGEITLYSGLAFVGQCQNQASCICGVGRGVHQATLDEAVDDPLDGRHVHCGFAAEITLRAGLQILELDERRPLGGRQLLGDQAGEDRDVALVRLAQEEADLLAQCILGVVRFRCRKAILE